MNLLDRSELVKVHFGSYFRQECIGARDRIPPPWESRSSFFVAELFVLFFLFLSNTLIIYLRHFKCKKYSATTKEWK